MINRLIIVIFVCFCFDSIAQNLVPNPSFETINSCNNSLLGAGILNGTAPPWDSPSTGSVDLFNICDTSASASVFWGIPINFLGYQQPHSGNGYAGAGFWAINNEREYIQIELDSTLVAQQYCVSFYVNLAERVKIAHNNIGMYFSNTHTYVPNYYSLNFTPQIINTNIITDTANWTLIYGQYAAHGGERYIIIGNFFNDSLTDTVHLNHGTELTYSYYYIDDVNVHCCTCDSINEGVGELGISSEELEIYPNPATNKLTIQLQKELPILTNLTITDILGQIVYTSKTNSKTTTIDITTYPSGVYFLSVKDKKKTINKKFVKE